MPRHPRDRAGLTTLDLIADELLARLIEREELLVEAANAGVTHRPEKVARAVIDDEVGREAARSVAATTKLEVDFAGPYESMYPAPETTPPVPVKESPETWRDAPAIMHEMVPGGEFAGQGDADDADDWTRLTDERRAERAAELADEIDAEMTVAVVGALRTAAAGLQPTESPSQELDLPQIRRLVDMVTFTAIERADSGAFAESRAAEEAVTDTPSPHRRAIRTGPRWIEDKVRNTDRDHPRSLSDGQTGVFGIVEAVSRLFTERTTRGATLIDPPANQWQDTKAIMDEMEPGSELAGQGSGADAATWERHQDDEIRDRHSRQAPFTESLAPNGTTTGPGPALPDAVSSGDPRASRYPAFITVAAVFGTAGIVALLVWIAGGWGEQPADVAAPPVVASSPSGSPTPASDVPTEEVVGPTVGDTSTQPAPTTAPEDATTTAAPSPADTVAATITVTHAPADASGAARAVQTTVCEVSATLASESTLEAEMAVSCGGDLVQRLGLLAIVHGDGEPSFPIDDIAEGTKSLTLTGAVDIGDDAEVFLHWEMMFGGLDMLDTVTSSSPDIITCSLRNGPMGSAGTHAADCFFGDPPG